MPGISGLAALAGYSFDGTIYRGLWRQPDTPIFYFLIYCLASNLQKVSLFMGARLHSIEYFLPERVLTNDELEQRFLDFSAKKIEEKIGVRKRHIVSEGETALDLAYKASEGVFQTFDRTKIDFVLLCTQSPDYLLPTSACILQDRLGLRTDVGALDYNLGCSGFIYGLAIAKGLIEAEIATTVLLVTSETYTAHIHPRDRSNLSVFGDGAAATIIERAEKGGIHDFVLGTDGKGYKNLIIPNGGLRARYEKNALEKEGPKGSFRTDNNLFMDGPEVFNFTIENIPKLVSGVLKKNNRQLDDLDYIIFHQANSYMLNYLRRRLKLPKDKFYIDLMNTGNTVSATIPIALKDCLDSNFITKGDTVLLAGFGVGYSWGAAIVEL